jgi:hypothetical protein
MKQASDVSVPTAYIFTAEVTTFLLPPLSSFFQCHAVLQPRLQPTINYVQH